MMMTLYDDETITKNREARIRREVTERVTKRVTKKVTREVTNQVTAQEQEKGIRMTVSAYKNLNGSFSAAVEAVASGYGCSEEEAEKEVMKYWD